MELSLRVLVLFVSILIFIVVFELLRREKIPIKFSLLWMISDIIIFLVAVFPNFLEFFTHLIGFQTISNMTIGILLVILFLITIVLTVIIAGQRSKIQLLIQEISMLKENIAQLQNKD